MAFDQQYPMADARFSDYAHAVIGFLASTPLLEEWPESRRVLLERASKEPSWCLAFPLISCQAVGATTDAIPVAAAWSTLHHAAVLIDAVQDGDHLPVSGLDTPAIAITLATGLIAAAFRFLDCVDTYPGASRRLTKLFSEAMFYSSMGQHLSLTQHLENMSLTDALHAYWFAVITKSGSIFRAAAAGGAAAGTDSEYLITTLGEFGNCLGVIRQIIDDCCDVLPSLNTPHSEISLPLLLFCVSEQGDRIPPQESLAQSLLVSREVLLDLLHEANVPGLITDVLLEWRRRALEILSRLEPSESVTLLQAILHCILMPVSLES